MVTRMMVMITADSNDDNANDDGDDNNDGCICLLEQRFSSGRGQTRSLIFVTLLN